MRVYELAKQLGMNSKELLVKLKSLNVSVKSHMSVLDDETAEIVKHELEDLERKEIEANVIEVDFPITIKDLAVKLKQKPSDILKLLLKEGKFYNINHRLTEEEAKDIGVKFKVNLKRKPTKEEEILSIQPKELHPRHPVVTLMGHIDHGKTSILDYIRKSRVTAKEAGGITQHIGAYQIDTPKGKITFLDTPGHETFTAMRARGANITDIVIIVVAADEGVKPQTIEAIDHAKAAGVPIIVAINKVDKPNADIDMVKQQLSKLGLVPDDWGGKTSTVAVSAKTGEGIDDLLELILLEAELLELKADPYIPAQAVVIEAKLTQGKGPVVDVLVKQGTLKVSDICICGEYWGKVRAMYDCRGNLVREAGPSSPVELLGLNGVPTPGDKLLVVASDNIAKEIVRKRKEEKERQKLVKPAHMKLEELKEKIDREEVEELKIILKADVGGTLEAIEDAVRKLAIEEIKINFIHKGVGAINTSDVVLAEASDAIIIGFKVPVDNTVRELAKQKGIQIRAYQIIYELIDEIKSAIEGLVTPEIRKVFIGRASVKKVFRLSKAGVIAGCVVEKGVVVRNALCHIVRDNEIIFNGKIRSLKRFKDDVREVREGMECGISVGYDQIKEGDIIEVFREETIMRKIER